MNSEMNKGETLTTLEQMVEGIVLTQQSSDEERAEELQRNQRIADLRAAYGVLSELKNLLSSGPMFPYALIRDARGHVDDEISKLYREKCGFETKEGQ